MADADGIVGILLAAGSATRFGSDKLLHPLSDGTPMALASARNLLSACPRCLVVVRPQQEALHELLSAAGFAVLVVEDAYLGMGHSLAGAVQGVPAAAG